MSFESQLFAQASPEFWLVAACCRWPDDTARQDAVSDALKRPLQWERVLMLARRHRISGLVAHALERCESVPEEVRRTLAQAKQKILFENMHAVQTEARLTKLFQQQDISFAVLKGVPLAIQAYGNLSLRQSRDIDFLIDPSDLSRVHELLLSAGYRRAGLGAQLTAHQQTLWMSVRKHFEYESISGGAPIEVHWRSNDNRYLGEANLPVNGLESVSVASGLSLPVLPRSHLLLDLCAHGAGHAWFRLKWIADIAALLAQTQTEEQKDLLRQAHESGLERPVMQAVLLCHSLFGTAAPRRVKRLSSQERLMLRIAAHAMLDEHDSTATSMSHVVPKNLMLHRLLMRNSWRYRVEEVRLTLTEPADWMQVHLPHSWRWLYWFLRLPLWVKRRWMPQRRKTSGNG